MNLEELNRLDKNAQELQFVSEQLTFTASRMSDMRNNPNRPLSQIVYETVRSAERREHYVNKHFEKYLLEVIDEHKHEMLRLAELRIAAEARSLKIKAAQNKGLVMASIVDVGGAA